MTVEPLRHCNNHPAELYRSSSWMRITVASPQPLENSRCCSQATHGGHKEQVREESSERGKDAVTAAERRTQPTQHRTLNGNRSQGMVGAR